MALLTTVKFIPEVNQEVIANRNLETRAIVQANFPKSGTRPPGLSVLTPKCQARHDRNQSQHEKNHNELQ